MGIAGKFSWLTEATITQEPCDFSRGRFRLDILLRQQQGERLQRYLPSDIKIAHKCGDLDNLENDGGIIWLGGKAYILVILTNGMPNLQCKQTIGKISKFVYDKMEESLE